MFRTTVTTVEDLEEATEIIDLVDEMLAANYSNLKFEHLFLWWMASEPAEA